jgi:NitT/TauT family transport system permease protein
MSRAMRRRVDPPALLALALGFLALAWPLAVNAVDPAAAVRWTDRPEAVLAWTLVGLIALWRLWRPRDDALAGGVIAVVVALGAITAYWAFADAALALAPDSALGAASGSPVRAGLGLWGFVGALGLLAWRAMELLSASTGTRAGDRALGLAVPALFGLWLLFLWQVIVQGFGIPGVLLPAPTVIAASFAQASHVLAADFYQTFIKSVLSGYAMGCAAGFLVAVLVDRVPFLQRGLLPLGNLVSALPIIGIAPIMVMWFGFDWQSKAAVVVVMTFFPMLVNTITGLAASERMQHDLMRSYAAGYWQTLLRLRLPNALPFVFNALKINSTLALIGAIVAEFFGTPIVGMGFRISTEVGRMNIDMVWATIVVAAVAGSVFYGAVALLERAFTFWHPSYRT